MHSCNEDLHFANGEDRESPSMKSPYQTPIGFTQFVALLFLGISLSACAGFPGFGGTSWKEEVVLHDGSKIIIERTASRHGPHEIGQRPPIGDQSITFTIPRTNQKVVWKDEYSEDVSGANFNLMMLDIVQETAYVLATPAGCMSYNKWGRPNPPYVIFEYSGKEWRRIPLRELPANITRPNLLQSSPDEVAGNRAKRGVVTAEVIQEEREEYRQPEFRTILRESYPGAAAGCSEMIRTNDGWEGLGFFKYQRSYEACSKYCERKGVGQSNCPCETLFERAK